MVVPHRSFSSFKHTEGLHHRNSACLTVRPSVSAVVCVVCSVTVSISLCIRVFVTLTRVRVCVSRGVSALSTCVGHLPVPGPVQLPNPALGLVQVPAEDRPHDFSGRGACASRRARRHLAPLLLCSAHAPLPPIKHPPRDCAVRTRTSGTHTHKRTCFYFLTSVIILVLKL